MSTFAKKATSAVAALSIVFSIVAPAAGVSASFTSLEAANKLAEMGVIVDQSANPADYRLGDTISRREATKVMILSSDLMLDESCTGQFADLSASDWGCKYAETALAAGMVAANPNFRPDANISKIEALKMAFQARDIERYENADWRVGYVEAAVDMGLSASFTDFDTAATRGEVFIMMANAIDATMLDDDDDLDDLLCAILGTCDDDDDVVDPTDPTDPIVVVGGDVMVSLNPMSPAAQTVPNSGLVPFGKFDVTAGDSDTSISSITLTREGLSQRSDVRRVYFERNGVRVSNRAGVTIDDKALISFSPALVVQAGQTVTLDLVVELNTGADTGAEHRFALLSAGDIAASGNVQGTYPVRTATMRLGSYTVAGVDVDVVSATGSTLTVGETNRSFGELSVQTSGDENTIVKSVTFRNEGTGDVASSLSNVGLYSDGQKVSTNVEMSGRDVTFTLNFPIENGQSENFDLRADVTGAERTSETYDFRVRNETDITVVEARTGFSAPITFLTNPLSLGRVTVEGGDLILSRDSSFTLNQTVAKNSTNVALWAANLSVDEAITVEDVTITFTNSGSSAVGLGSISSLRLVVGGSTVATISPANNASSTQTFESSFTVNSNTPIRIEANFRNSAEGTYTIGTVSFDEVRYVANDELTTIAGSATGISTLVDDATLTVTRNDGVDNNSLVPGARDVTLLGFQLRANDVADVRVTAVRPVVTGGVDISNVTNVRLYQGSTLLATRNNFDFSSVNVTVPKNTSMSFTIVADFNNAVNPLETIQLTLSGTNVTARDVSSNQTVNLGASSATSENFVFNAGGSVEVVSNSSQANRSIIVPSTTENSVFRFDVEAEDDRARVTDVYVTRTGSTLNLAQAVRSSSLTLGGTTVSGVIISNSVIHFPFGSQGVLLERDDRREADFRISFFDSQTRTNIPFRFDVPTGAVSGQIAGTENGMRIISDSTGLEITRTGGVISSREHLLARSKPTVARLAEADSSTAYKFTVTADQNRRITLDSMVFNIRGIAQTGATFELRRDGSNDIIATGTGNLVTGGTNVTLDSFALDDEVAASATMTYVLEISGVDTQANVDRTREVRLTNLEYLDDVTSGATAITTAPYNVLPTTPSTFRY
ncbi:S-layer homology domain-containing protein [Candidatus Gracilibacteria bacterium]|nr:S-layer homology domain-containing protein [Candidatus Gracilibacteria bacterium]